MQASNHSPGFAASPEDFLFGEEAILHSLQLLCQSENRYRQSCLSEDATLSKQLSLIRDGIQSLQDRLLVALDGDFQSQASTAHIHRELGLLMDIERAIIDRLNKVREQLIISSQQELRAEIDVRRYFAELLPTRHVDLQPGPAPIASPQGASEILDLIQQLLAQQLPNSASNSAPIAAFNFRNGMSYSEHTSHGPVTDPLHQVSTFQPPVVKSKRMYHAFLTHNWGDPPLHTTHERVKQIFNALKGMGLSLWFDVERMAGGNVIQDMTSGIDQSDVVVVFVTKAYCQKVNKQGYDNCKIEFMYAVNRKCSMMVAVPLDEDTLSAQSWDGPVGAILGSNLYPAKFWDRGEINVQHPEFSVEIKKLYDRIVIACGDSPASASSKAASSHFLCDATSSCSAVCRIPSKANLSEIILKREGKLAHKVALHACAFSPSVRQMLQSNRKWSRDAIAQKILKKFDAQFLNACNDIIDLQNDIGTDIVMTNHRVHSRYSSFFMHVSQLASVPHTQEKFDQLTRKLRQLEAFGKPYRVAYQEDVGFFHAFLLASPHCVASDDILVLHARKVLSSMFLKPYDRRGWTMSSAFEQLWLGIRDINELFGGDVDARTKRCFEFGFSEYCSGTGLKPELGIAQIPFGDINPFFDLLVFIKTLGDLVDSEQSHKDVWDEINSLFDTQPPLHTFKVVVSLVRRQNEWNMNIPGSDASEQVKQLYSSRLLTATTQLQKARDALKTSHPASLALWDRATQHPPLPKADLTLRKLHEINLKRQLDGLVKTVSMMACDAPVGNLKVAHDRLVFEFMEVLQDIEIDCFGQTRTIQNLAPIIRQLILTDDVQKTCADVAQTQCSGDEIALFFANLLDDSFRRYSESREELEFLSKDYSFYLLPLIHTVIGQIGSSDNMLYEHPHDTTTAQATIKRAAELCFPVLACSARKNECGGGQRAEKSAIITKWQDIPGMRHVMESLWKDPYNFEASLSLAIGQAPRRLARVVYELIKKEIPKNTIAGCLNGLSIIVKRIAELRDERNSQRGNMRFCSGGFLAERREFMDDQGSHMIQLEDAGINIRSAVKALWNGERHCDILFSLCSTTLERLVFRNILMHVEEKLGQCPEIHCDLGDDVGSSLGISSSSFTSSSADSPRAFGLSSISDVTGSVPVMITDNVASAVKKYDVPGFSGIPTLSDDDKTLLIEAFCELNDSPLSGLVIIDVKDHHRNAACITVALNAVPPLDIFELLQRFVHCEEMCEAVLQIKSMNNSSTSYNRAMRSLSLSNLDFEEKKICVAVGFLIFLGVPETPRAEIPLSRSATSEIHESAPREHSHLSSDMVTVNVEDCIAAAGHRAGGGSDSSPPVVVNSSHNGSPASGPVVDPVFLHVPSDEVLRALRNAVVAFEDDSLDELELSDVASDDAIRANSATIYVVLKREPDFFKIEARLISLLSVLPDASYFIAILRQIHEFDSCVGTMRQNLPQVLNLLSESLALGSFHPSGDVLTMICYVSALFFS